MTRPAALFAALILALVLPLATAAAPARDAAWHHGLIWRDSPLPASFPLLVKTPAGVDFLLQLEDATSGAVVLGAGIEGGRFFRVLVPNGRYVVNIAYRPAEAAGVAFGAAAGRLRIEPPLSFEIHGVARKQGHVITLSRGRDGFDVALRGQALCQRSSRLFVGPVIVPEPVAPLPADSPAPGTVLADQRPPLPRFGDGPFALKTRVVVCD